MIPRDAKILPAVLLGLSVALQVPLPGTTAASTSSGLQLMTLPDQHLSPVLQLIRSARSSIRLEMYLLTNRQIVRALGGAARNGVQVRVMLEQHPFQSSRYAALGYALLRSVGVAVRWANERAFRFTHEKAMVVDDRTAGIFTFNLTSSGIYRNREFGIVDRNADDARALAAIFDADWARRSAERMTDRSLVVSPYNSRNVLQSIVDSARRTLDVYVEEVDDPGIEDHLARAVRRGVRVRQLVPAESAGVEVLRRAGIAVEVLAHPYVHAKAIVADRSSFFVGSQNFSGVSLEQNREVGIIARDLGVAGAIEHTFNLDWRRASTTMSGGEPPRTTSTPQFGVSLSVSPRTVHRGELVTITVVTQKGAVCSIEVTYPDGYVSRARVLQTEKTASVSGIARWAWREGSRAAGSASARATCSLGNSRESRSISFTIDP